MLLFFFLLNFIKNLISWEPWICDIKTNKYVFLNIIFAYWFLTLFFFCFDKIDLFLFLYFFHLFHFKFVYFNIWRKDWYIKIPCNFRAFSVFYLFLFLHFVCLFVLLLLFVLQWWITELLFETVFNFMKRHENHMKNSNNLYFRFSQRIFLFLKRKINLIKFLAEKSYFGSWLKLNVCFF